MINARAEILQEKASFKNAALPRKRLLAQTFYADLNSFWAKRKSLGGYDLRR
jgi:putative SOS response-associated peptidase YedK